jgi:hypothetical protein
MGHDLEADAPAEALENARSMLTYRQLSSGEACSGFADWAHGFTGMVTEHALPPVLRIGAIVPVGSAHATRSQFARHAPRNSSPTRGEAAGPRPITPGLSALARRRSPCYERYLDEMARCRVGVCGMF